MSASNLKEWIVKTKKDDIPKFKKKVAVVLLRECVNRTPVDTGWARMHWRVDNVLSADNPGSAPKGSKPNEFPAATPGAFSGEGDIYVYNSVPYIGPLDSGTHSKQIGKGQMVEGAMIAARAKFGDG